MRTYDYENGSAMRTITELAGELKATVTVEEFHTLNRMHGTRFLSIFDGENRV
jgi:hypothetical protein